MVSLEPGREPLVLFCRYEGEIDAKAALHHIEVRYAGCLAIGSDAGHLRISLTLASRRCLSCALWRPSASLGRSFRKGKLFGLFSRGQVLSLVHTFSGGFTRPQGRYRGCRSSRTPNRERVDVSVLGLLSTVERIWRVHLLALVPSRASWRFLASSDRFWQVAGIVLARRQSWCNRPLSTPDIPVGSSFESRRPQMLEVVA